ncbi:hypothetical protein GOBAR_AA26221 [Gossypium barbadense]|uniref:Uncharacterized protein n=1 Tax=Gossypium barbadense TaxID=3634 RepID=A0A2P5WTP5_GOSBA|nr:hypothetical protein GOBAR_AA26221 [Gossypium barbadense]
MDHIWLIYHYSAMNHEFYVQQENFRSSKRLVGKVAKLDFNTNSKTRGHFTRMAIFINLDRPLVSQVLEICTLPSAEKGFEIIEASDNSESSNQASNGESLAFGLWMLVERKTWQGQRDQRNQREGALEKATLRSIYLALNGMDNIETTVGNRKVLISINSTAKLKRNEKKFARIMGIEKADLKLGDDRLSVGLVEGVDSGSIENKIRVDGLAKQVNGFIKLGNSFGDNIGTHMNGKGTESVAAVSNDNKQL